VIRHEAAATAARTKRITAERGRSGQRLARLPVIELALECCSLSWVPSHSGP
jgi:hypothetical protein